MSFGDHLEDLRGCLIRSLVGVVLGAAVALYFGKATLALIYRPLLIVQANNGLPPNLQALSPTAAFSAYLKIGLLSGLILAMPWVLHELWTFVGTGLYPHERRFVRRLIVPSVGLFAVGVLFLYSIVLPILLQFFISFNEAFDTPNLSPTTFQTLLLQVDKPPETNESAQPAQVPLLKENPPDPKPGEIWVNTTTTRLMLMTSDGVWSTSLERRATPSAMRSQFAIDFYISFVLTLALAFGVAFETPIVVFFLCWSGIVPPTVMARARRYVLLGAVIAAAVLTPPDVISQLLLAGPIYLLFEIGLLAARVTERKKGGETTAE